jgi:hypothetical protein
LNYNDSIIILVECTEPKKNLRSWYPGKAWNGVPGLPTPGSLYKCTRNKYHVIYLTLRGLYTSPFLIENSTF